MDISGKRIWQVAAGNADRNYADLCLCWDVILNGPGSDGPWPACAESLREWVSARKLTDLRRFCEEISDGDIVVLRVGTTDVFGVGTVAGDYLWHEEFGDVDGWDLQHVRRVRWLWRYDATPMRFDTHTLKLGDCVQIMDSRPVLDWIAGLAVDQSTLERPLKELPEPSKDSDLHEIAVYLFDHGVSSTAIRHLTERVDELIRIARSEAETIGNLVIPLLMFWTLGWEKMAVGWCGVDVALFDSMPQSDENLAVMVELKQNNQSCLTAPFQAQAYAEQPGRESCGRIIVTDGLRYGVYLRENGRFKSEPEAYLNLTRMRDAYPVLSCAGARKALLLMAADWTQPASQAG